MDLVQASLKAAAVSVIFMIWASFTIEAFISTSPQTYKAVSKVMCEECKEFFNEDGKNICFTCRGDFSIVD